MAIPLPELQRSEEAVMVSTCTVKPRLLFRGLLEESEEKSPILTFLLFHKAVRNELDVLHRLALAFATGNSVNIQSLFQRYGFFRSIYKQHSVAEDEVLLFFPASFCYNFRILWFFRRESFKILNN
ncbi:hypothetical protein GQ457_04G039090 [Hibiscus cannabinus]